MGPLRCLMDDDMEGEVEKVQLHCEVDKDTYGTISDEGTIMEKKEEMGERDKKEASCEQEVHTN